MSRNNTDEHWMRKALTLARRAEGRVEPNPMVGAVIVEGGRLVGKGYHRRFGAPHAEVHALRDAGKAAKGATMYVTLEPCAHHGKTPPCAPAVAEAGLRRVLIATLDPTPKARGRGIMILEAAGIEAKVGLCSEEAVVMNAPFFKMAHSGKPLVTAKWAMSADGKIATHSGSSAWISSRLSRSMVHRLRGRADAIIIGSGTALRDDPLLTCRSGEKRRTAARIVLCRNRAPSLTSRLVQSVSEAPVLIAYPEGSSPDGLDALVEAGCEAVPVPPSTAKAGQVSPAMLLDALGRRGMSAVLVEGGRAVLGSFFDTGQVDRVVVFVAPLIIGGRGAIAAVGGKGVVEVADSLQLCRTKSRRVGPDLLLEGWIHDPLIWAP